MNKLISLLLLVAFTGVARAESVVNTVHNLSANGPGTIRATAENNACFFCHTVHKASGVTPLWNHSMSAVSNYVVYASDRLNNLNVTIPQPNGSSRLCLSCHDGTVALGSITFGSGSTIPMQNSVTTMPVGDASNLGQNLAADHPISFVYDQALAQRDSDVNDPTKLSTKAVRMDSLNRLQCTSCHDPHNNQFGNFLVVDNSSGSALCLVCHVQNTWGSSAHALSSAPIPVALAKKMNRASGQPTARRATSRTVSANGCANCHVSHKAGTKASLMLAELPEQNCLVCHSGTPAKKNIATDFQKASVHPITVNSTAHSPVEDPVNPQTRHVVCADCHNSHAATAKAALVPAASGRLAGLTGVTAAGGIIKPLSREYELCFRCHADSLARGPALVSRQYPQTNTRLQFSPASQSYHPVVALGKNQTSVPSLIKPWTTTSLMYCTDCHNSDTGPNAGGSGANGPHGSLFRPILERNLELADGQAETPFAYALCYKCHDRNKVLSPASFAGHEKHVVEQKTACTTCHDSHGVANQPHLVNFNTTYVTAGSLGSISYTPTAPGKGICTLMCHGKDHRNAAY